MASPLIVAWPVDKKVKMFLRRVHRCILLGIVLCLLRSVAAAAAAREGTELIGTKALSWGVTNWINSQPLSLDALRGSVVLVRWWTGPECPYCALSAPYLKTWDEKYHTHGLIVVGLYHHKSAEPLSRQHVEQLVKRYGFMFPVAIDPDWGTLKRWWLEGRSRPWTSVSFLIDQQGIIRSVHPGGSYTEAEAEAMEFTIQELLKTPQPVTSATGGTFGR